MVERLRYDVTTSLLLQIVVADLRSGIQTLFDIAFFQRAEHGIVLMSPNACIKVGLQLETYAELV